MSFQKAPAFWTPTHCLIGASQSLAQMAHRHAHKDPFSYMCGKQTDKQGVDGGFIRFWLCRRVTRTSRSCSYKRGLGGRKGHQCPRSKTLKFWADTSVSWTKPVMTFSSRHQDIELLCLDLFGNHYNPIGTTSSSNTCEYTFCVLLSRT